MPDPTLITYIARERITEPEARQQSTNTPQASGRLWVATSGPYQTQETTNG